MESKSVVLNKFKQLCEVKYTGTTPVNYTKHVSKFLDHAANVPNRVTNEDILNYNIFIRHYSNSYRNVAINAIKAYFKLYLRKTVKEFSSIRPRREFKTIKVYDAEILAIKIRNIQNLKHKAILTLGLSGWLRVSEVVNLKISDIDSVNMLIHIKQSKGKKDRDVTLTPETLCILRTYYKTHKPTDYLFNGQGTLPQYSKSSCNKLCKKYLDSKMRFHNLRSSGANYAHKKGMSLFDISNMLGHAKIETTKYYLSSNLATVKQAI